MAEQNSVQSVERTFKIIELLCKRGSCGVTELSAESSLNKTTVFRLLSTLLLLGYVEKDGATEKYSLTLKFLKLSSSLLTDIDIRHYAREHLERIAAATGETVHLVERSGNEIIYIDKFDSAQNSVRMVSRIGLSLPMVYTAVGKSIMARLPENEVKEIWNSTKIEKKTEKTVTSYTKFLKELDGVRKNGYATDNEENEEGVCCVAAAVADVYGEYRYAFSVSAPVSRMNGEKLAKVGKAVVETAKRISNGEKADKNIVNII